jgi:radical SAM protein with 4Fe4S-binding SPASM domain
MPDLEVIPGNGEEVINLGKFNSDIISIINNPLNTYYKEDRRPYICNSCELKHECDGACRLTHKSPETLKERCNALKELFSFAKNLEKQYDDFFPDKKRKTVIVSVSPWAGRSYTTALLKNKNSIFRILNLSTGTFSRIKNSCYTDRNLKDPSFENQDFPLNMIEYIKSKMGKYDFILIGQQIPIFELIENEQIPYVLVCVDNSIALKDRMIQIVDNSNLLCKETAESFINSYFSYHLQNINTICRPYNKYRIGSVDEWFDEKLLQKIYDENKGV